MATINGHSQRGMIKAICISKAKGQKKHGIKVGVLKKDFGIINDAHAGSIRQVSLLAEESIGKMKSKGLNVGYGDFAENIVTSGIDVTGLSVGTKIKIGKYAVVEVSQIGKVCVSRCAIYYKTGDCIMPKEGIFATVVKGGAIKTGDRLEVITDV